MKTKILLIISIFSILFLSSCKKEDSSQFDYPMETLYGTWSGTDIYLEESSQWVDITRYPFTQFAFSAKFNVDGTYYGSGYFGNGSGTYKAIGNTINTYIDGEEFARYVIQSLTGTVGEATMYMGSSKSGIRIKLKKK